MRRSRGIALFTVLLVSGVLILMLTSFVKLNRQHLSVLKNDLHHVAASEAARSVMEYGVYKLEQNRYWGGERFKGKKDPDTRGILEIKEVRNTHRVEGKVLQSGAEFTLDILNNIDGSAPVDGVAKGHCRLRIQSTLAGATVNREVVMTTAPLFDGAVVASDRIDIDANSLTLSSTDPMRNRMRSKKAIAVPDYRSGSFKFNPADSATERGILWAKRGITSGGRDLSDPDIAQDASARTGGQFLPKADTHYDVYDLQLSEVRSTKHSVKVDSGLYVFGRRKVAYTGDMGTEYTYVPVVERRDWAIDADGNKTQGNVREMWYMPDSLPQDAQDWRIGLWGDIPNEGLHAEPDGHFALDDGVFVHFNSLDPSRGDAAGPPEIVINSDVNLEVDGDFGVASASGRYNPTIIFRDPETGAVSEDKHGNVVSGSITAHAANGKPGSIYIEGKIEGNGKLLAEGDVTLKHTYAKVDSDKKSDLSIFAGGSVAIKPQEAKWLDQHTEFTGWEKGADGTTAFRGLVFARENVTIEADKSRGNSEGKREDVYIEGAVVARNGSVQVRNANRVDFRYNPEYLDSMLTPSRESRVRLERVVFKEI